MNRGAVGDTGIAYRVDGPPEASVIVFINSLGTDYRMWDAQVEAFSNSFRVVRYDFCGHGVSEPPRGPVTIDSLGNDVLLLLDHLGIERAHLCGSSLGGMITQWTAATHPARVDRVVVANSAAKIGTSEGWNSRIAAVRRGGTKAMRESSMERFFSKRFRSDHSDIVQRMGDTVDAVSANGYIAACEALRDADLRPIVASIRARTLIIGGELDFATPPKLQEELHAAIPSSELLVISQAAHLSNIEQPAIFNDSVLRLLEERSEPS